jgi:DNA-directed RNA polymerase specialized sigma24 family protein
VSAAPRFELRPIVRGDCADGPRPCPHVSCRQHLLREWPLVGREALAASPDWAEGWRTHPATRGAGSLAEALARMPATCALDVVDDAPDGLPLEEIGRLLGCTRERARQIEAVALRKLAASAAVRRLRNG